MVKHSSSDNDELCFLGASEALSLFKSRELSPVELLDAYIAKAAVSEPTINAFSADRFEQAWESAREAENIYINNPDSAGSLCGICVAVKDEMTIEGEITSEGSLLSKDNIGTSTHPMVERLLSAGAIVHARTTVPEFSSAVFTRNKLNGVTTNPWNTDYSPGGSSGGSAASLAAGTSALATGSDIAGSIRVPASLCGLVGLKPSYGRVPESDPFYSLDTYNHNGPMARSVEDCALMFNIINGPHPADLASIRPKLEVPAEFDDIKGIRIACSMNLGFFDIDEEVFANTFSLCETLKTLGAIVEDIDISWDARLRDAARAHFGFRMGRDIAKNLSSHRSEMNDYCIELAEIGLSVEPENYLDSISRAGQMYKPLGSSLEYYDALICPTLATTGWPASGKPAAFELIMQECMTWPFNMLSRCPVLSVPSGFASNGLPTGVQIVGKSYDDLSVLRIGAKLQSALQWQKRHPQL